MIAVPGGDLVVEALTASYGPTPVLHGLSFRAPAGAVTALLGANGSGKTTALRAVAGLMDHGGQVSLGPTRLDALPRQERAVNIAYVPQRTQLDAPLPVEVVVGHGRFLKRTGHMRRDVGAAEAVDAALAATGTEALRKRAFTSLSGGERQRVLLARALATGARTLLLDEPTSAQDVAQGLLMARTLRDLAQHGTTILIVLHDLRQVRELADHAILLREGLVVGAGSALQITSDAPIRDVFGVRVTEGAGLGLALDSAPANRTTGFTR